MKKRGFGAGKYNGFGGKTKISDKSLTTTAIRELMEESEVEAEEKYLNKVGEITFIFPHNSSWNQLMHVYKVTNWDGEPKETKEMKPERFLLNNIPYNKMWEADSHWLPPILEGKYVKASFVYSENQTLLKKEVNIIPI